MKIKIKETARAKNDWSLYRLAKELKLPEQTIYGWQCKRTQPKFKNMEKMCSLLDCTMDDLFEAEPLKEGKEGK